MSVPRTGRNFRLQLNRNRGAAGSSFAQEKIIGSIADFCLNGARVIALRRDVHLALATHEVFFARDFELLYLERVGLEIYLGCELIDLSFKERERVARCGQKSAEFALAGVERPFDDDCTREIARLGTKKFRELSEFCDLSQNLAAKIGIEPISRFGRVCTLTAHVQFFLALLNVELLELDVSVVKNRAEHNKVGRTIVPAQSV